MRKTKLRRARVDGETVTYYSSFKRKYLFFNFMIVILVRCNFPLTSTQFFPLKSAFYNSLHLLFYDYSCTFYSLHPLTGLVAFTFYIIFISYPLY